MPQSLYRPCTLGAPCVEPRRRTSEVVFSTIDQLADDSVNLRMLTGQFGTKTFGVLLVFMSIFTTLPLISSFAGMAITLLGVQMILGYQRAWLPEKVLDRRVPSKHIKVILSKFGGKIRAVEKYIRPRKLLASASLVNLLNGLVVLLMGVIVIIPFPFLNILPTLIIILLGLGLMESDELMQMFVSSLVIFTICMLSAIVFVF